MVTGALPACRTDPSDSAGLRNHHDSIPKFGRLVENEGDELPQQDGLRCSRVGVGDAYDQREMKDFWSGTPLTALVASKEA